MAQMLKEATEALNDPELRRKFEEELSKHKLEESSSLMVPSLIEERQKVKEKENART